ncbi:hypothetical protein PUNSTDRAFT_99521 [Punctularia strigosozonata HHB-11173 SS5]|uniref:uncharacterized protein n=1 Tax=Punctularia strigosozonata (strain HHB-11173) TaxID=741275 RepID=UPI00044185D5|nr:uncharacterized protein PUNSTDRAFT_99521 [Punctularia strigosozonata HHB-11173 SS5]EIN12102.1 hypothetical protein PUNSTDRAFT_99521 [Punctularia strigosozonata HHB-11173 SS5]
MLPEPVTGPQRQRSGVRSLTSKTLAASTLPHINPISSLYSPTLRGPAYTRRLLARSPLTNAGALVLLAILALSLLTNISYWLSSASPRHNEATANAAARTRGVWIGSGDLPPRIGGETAGNVHVVGSTHKSSAVPISPPDSYDQPYLERIHSIARPEWTDLINHLVIVPGHAIWTGTDPRMRLSESEWVLEPYQQGGGRIRAFFSHIVRGADIVLKDPDSLLMFSGGQTRPSSPMTEADSYLRLALASNVFHVHNPSDTDSAPPMFHRVATETFALDSLQNLQFSLARFHEVTGHYPEKITVVGYEMKRRRFEELHRRALRWPSSRFEYIGVDIDAGENGAEREQAMQGELTNAYKPYLADLYGCHPPLSTKRLARNSFIRFHPYLVTSDGRSSSATASDDREGDRSVETGDGLRGLLEWCPTDDWTRVYEGKLPWDP